MTFVSKYFQAIDYDDESNAIWHSIFGRPMLCSKQLSKRLLRIANSESRFIDLCEFFGSDFGIDENIEEIISDLREAHIINATEEQENEDLRELYDIHNPTGANKVRYLSLIMSEECNFRCKYCIHFANSKHQYNPTKFMTEEMAKKSIDQYLEIIKNNNLESAYINFGGGEPLLNWKVIQRLLNYIEERREQYSFPINLGINTNMSLMTREIAQSLVDHKVFVAASLDGFKDGNDSVRLTKNLNGTFERIINGFHIMESVGSPLDGFAMTVTEENFTDVTNELVDWAESMRMSELRIDIDVVGMVRIPVETIVQRLSGVRKYAQTKGISVIGFWSRPAENLGLIPESDDIGFCGGERGNSLCVAPSGQVFPCGYSNYELTTFDKISKIHKQPNYAALLANRQLTKHEECAGCPIIGFCRGGCMITKEANNTTEKPLRMCDLYRAMTYEIIRESACG